MNVRLSAISPTKMLTSFRTGLTSRIVSLPSAHLCPRITSCRYDFFKSNLLRRSSTLFNYQLKDNLLLHVIASLMAGTVATSAFFPTSTPARSGLTRVLAVCSPADVMRTRIMSSVRRDSSRPHAACLSGPLSVNARIPDTRRHHIHSRRGRRCPLQGLDTRLHSSWAADGAVIRVFRGMSSIYPHFAATHSLRSNSRAAGGNSTRDHAWTRTHPTPTHHTPNLCI